MTRSRNRKLIHVTSLNELQKLSIYALAHLNLLTASFKCLNAFNVLCAQLTRDLLAIAKFLLLNSRISARYNILTHFFCEVMHNFVRRLSRK